MVVVGLNATSPILSGATVKGYRELLKRLHHNKEDTASSRTLILQAKLRAIHTLQLKREKGHLSPKRALIQLRDRLVSAKENLRHLKEEKRGRLKAAYAALREQHEQSGTLSSSAFPEGEATILGHEGLWRKLVLGAVGSLSKGFMGILTRTEIRGQAVLENAFQRPSGQGLITVSNHTAALDDPLILAVLMPQSSMLRPEAFRWGMCATDRCFKSYLMGAFFRAGKTLPIERGKGINQAGVKAAQDRLKAGDWVHIFPEGTRSRNGKLGPIRRGIGHIIAACQQPPLVIPFVHSGMEHVLPPGSSFPRLGQNVKISVGQPLDFADLTLQAEGEAWDQESLSSAISQRVADTLYSLMADLNGLPVSAITEAFPETLTEDIAGHRERQETPVRDHMSRPVYLWRHSSAAEKASFDPARVYCEAVSPGQNVHASMSELVSQAKSLPRQNNSLTAFKEYWQHQRAASTSLGLFSS